MIKLTDFRNEVVAKSPQVVTATFDIQIDLGEGFNVIDALNHLEEVADKIRELANFKATGKFGEAEFEID